MFKMSSDLKLHSPVREKNTPQKNFRLRRAELWGGVPPQTPPGARRSARGARGARSAREAREFLRNGKK